MALPNLHPPSAALPTLRPHDGPDPIGFKPELVVLNTGHGLPPKGHELEIS